MPKILYRILAHDNLESLEGMASDLREMTPGAELILFNGGQNSEWLYGGT